MDTAAVRTLVGAGFSEQDAIAALARTGGDPDEASLLLLGDELAPARAMRCKLPYNPRHLEAPQRRGPDWGGALPQEVLEVLGKWLNQHLAAFNGRPRLKPCPEYLHPLAINKYRATHSIKEIESGRTRLVATREMLLALRACRQSCRVWRDEISYRGVTELALDGVLHIGRLSPVQGMYGLPSLEQMIHDAGHASSQLCQPNVYTWWPGHRTLQENSPGSAGSTGSSRKVCRCPACRTPQRKIQKQSKHPRLKQFMDDQGIGNWLGPVTELLGITSISALRQMTTYELMELARKHNYNEPQMLEAAPKIIAKVKEGGDWESRKTSEGSWSCTNGQKYAEHSHCDECGLACLTMDMESHGHESSVLSITCETCGFNYCTDCAEGVYNDSRRPQTVDEILPDDFPVRFSNLKTLSLCDLELPYLPSSLARCKSLVSLNVSGNKLRSLSPRDKRGLAEVDRPSARDSESRLTVLPSGLLNLDLSARSEWADIEGSESDRLRQQQGRKQHLSLSVGSLPAALQNLRLSNLGLQRLPVALRECKELRTLDLSYNNFAIRGNWTGLLPAAEGGVPGGSPWEEGDLSAEGWLGELRFLGELNLCNAVTIIRQSAGNLTPAQILAATAYFTQRTQLMQQREQAHVAMQAASETLRSIAAQEHAAFKDWQTASSYLERCKTLLSRCEPGQHEERSRLDADHATAEAKEKAAKTRREEAAAEHAAASTDNESARQAYHDVITAISNLGPAPVGIVAWIAHTQVDLAQLIEEGTRLTVQVLETLDEEHWLRKWDGQLNLVESQED